MPIPDLHLHKHGFNTLFCMEEGELKAFRSQNKVKDFFSVSQYFYNDYFATLGSKKGENIFFGTQLFKSEGFAKNWNTYRGWC